MSGMKISLDAAMRARDVSSPDWRDDSPADGDETARTADPARPIRTVASATDTGAPNATARDGDQGATKQASAATGTDGREPIFAPKPAPDGPTSGAAKAGSGDQSRRTKGPRRRRRIRLRPGGPA
jgi:hypothetical protein